MQGQMLLAEMAAFAGYGLILPAQLSNLSTNGRDQMIAYGPIGLE